MVLHKMAYGPNGQRLMRSLPPTLFVSGLLSLPQDALDGTTLLYFYQVEMFD